MNNTDRMIDDFFVTQGIDSRQVLDRTLSAVRAVHSRQRKRRIWTKGLATGSCLLGVFLLCAGWFLWEYRIPRETLKIRDMGFYKHSNVVMFHACLAVAPIALATGLAFWLATILGNHRARRRLAQVETNLPEANRIVTQAQRSR